MRKQIRANGGPLCLLSMPVLLDFGLTTKAYSAFPESTGSFCTGTNIIMSFCLKTIWNRLRVSS
jgi:hypothetical protein